MKKEEIAQKMIDSLLKESEFQETLKAMKQHLLDELKKVPVPFLVNRSIEIEIMNLLRTEFRSQLRARIKKYLNSKRLERLLIQFLNRLSFKK